MIDLTNKYDVIVIGAGHAGCEAAAASARMKQKTLLITHQIDTIGQMSCNPSIGGIGKSHLVWEIDALDGLMAKAANRSGIHFKYLNEKKGPAVRAIRAQADRSLYRKNMRLLIDQTENLYLFQSPVDDLIIENNKAVGVISQMGHRFFAKKIILTTGTFLQGKIHIGEQRVSAGRAGDPAATTLAQSLRQLPLNFGRLKTGTPARIARNSIDFSVTSPQPSDPSKPVFSFLGTVDEQPPACECYITQTSQKTHDIIEKHIHKAAVYTDEINGRGPRYCPSIEEKIRRFPDRPSHQIFIEPEGIDTNEVYPSGISTSLPADVQTMFIRSIAGLEHAHITRFGYAIEYDFFDPRDLYPWLESQYIEGLYLAGQINGTTGYEEAAAQGIIAGLNAALSNQERPHWYPKRHEAYIGVLLDDLTTKGAPEPYRMFTSRAEYRLMLREDNADMRLTDIGYKLGLVSELRHRQYQKKKDSTEHALNQLKTTWISSSGDLANKIFQATSIKIQKTVSATDLLRRPEIELRALKDIGPPFDLDMSLISSIEASIKYDGYIKRQLQEVNQLKNIENTIIPESMDYEAIKGLSNEARELLLAQRPQTLGQASRIPGIDPTTISLLMIIIKKTAKEKNS